MKGRLVRVIKDQYGSRIAEFELKDGTSLGLSLGNGADLKTDIAEAIEGYRKAIQKTEVTLPPELKDKEFDIPVEAELLV